MDLILRICVALVWTSILLGQTYALAPVRPPYIPTKATTLFAKQSPTTAATKSGASYGTLSSFPFTIVNNLPPLFTQSSWYNPTTAVGPQTTSKAKTRPPLATPRSQKQEVTIASTAAKQSRAVKATRASKTSVAVTLAPGGLGFQITDFISFLTTPAEDRSSTVGSPAPPDHGPCRNSTCHPLAKCSAKGAGYICTCPSTHRGNGTVCTPFCASVDVATVLAATALNQLGFLSSNSQRSAPANLSLPKEIRKTANAVKNKLPVVGNKVPAVLNPTDVLSATFPATNLGQTAFSDLKCNGRPYAKATCVKDSGNPQRAIFELSFNPTKLTCGDSISSIVKVLSSVVTSKAIGQNIFFLAQLTSFADTVTLKDAQDIVAALYQLATDVANEFTVTRTTLSQVLNMCSQVAGIIQSQSKGDLLGIKNEIGKTGIVIDKFSLKLQNAPPGAQFTPLSSSLVFTNDIAMQVQNVLPWYNTSAYRSWNFNRFGKQSSAVDVQVPGSVFQEASIAKNKSRLRVSYTVYPNDLFFPSKRNVSNIGYVNIDDYKPAVVKEPINVTFAQENARQGSKKLASNPVMAEVTRTTCMVWDRNKLIWSPNKCALVLGSSPPKCRCSVIASFAMIVDVRIMRNAFEMGIVSFVGCSLSVLGLFITLCIFLAIKELRERKTTLFLANICLCMMITNIIFMAGSGRINDRLTCYVSTALLHYFLLATWFWMSCNAFNMYQTLVRIVSVEKDVRTAWSVVSYVAPLIIVVITAGVTIPIYDLPNYRSDDIFFESAYRARHVCWLHLNPLKFAFIVPVGVLAIVNVIMFALVMRSITCKKKKIRSSIRKQKKLDDFVKAVQLVSLMGLTWIFGFLILVAPNVTYRQIMAWLFTITNSFQGLVIFYVNCVRNKKIRQLWWEPCCRRVCCLYKTKSESSFGNLNTISTTRT